MKNPLIFLLLVFFFYSSPAQLFERAVLSTDLSSPWEITYGADDFLWITESGGSVSRMNPSTGEKTIVYTAPDYFPGSALENLPACHNPTIGKGTLGLALHPDFISTNPYIYFVYSYNNGTETEPSTNFRIKRLTWDATSESVIADLNIVNGINSSYDHWGGRLMSIKQNDTPYLFLTVGDHGQSEINSPSCYPDQSNNPNNFTQDPNTQNGKIHRFNMDGTIPADNPISGNSFYSRGHRNPQGLMYNPNLDVIYSVEHGDRTDDEINIIHKGMNYGWKNIRGYHDENTPGEMDFVSNYVPHPMIPNDSLVEAFYSWCVTNDTSSNNSDWCTVAPSDGIYYGSDGISEWTNSLLVVTLKNGNHGDRELHQFKLTPTGDLAPSTIDNPNPKQFFGEDQAINGRLRDVAISPNGATIYLINHGGASENKVITYTKIPTSIHSQNQTLAEPIEVYPNPSYDFLTIKNIDAFSLIEDIRIYSSSGSLISITKNYDQKIDISQLPNGIYFINIIHDEKIFNTKFTKL